MPARTFIPIKDRSNYGELTFPKLKCAGEAVPTLKDLRQENVALTKSQRERKSRRLSNANKHLAAKLGATSEYRQVRYNLSYRPILDTLGDDFPLHPEYLYVIDIVITYYGIWITDLIEFIARSDCWRYDVSDRSFQNMRYASITNECCKMMFYLFYDQYKVNPNVIMSVFSVSLNVLRNKIDSFMRDFEMHSVVRADFNYLIGKLITLEPAK